MIHENLTSQDYRFDLSNVHANLLHSPTHHYHHQSQFDANKKFILPLYEKLQNKNQQMLSNEMYAKLTCSKDLQVQNISTNAEVLDLSRRCDSVETPPRKTPSPYQTNSSYGSGSPVLSPVSSNLKTQPQQQKIEFSALYQPALCFAQNIMHQEASINSTQAPQQLLPAAASITPNSDLLQTFASAAAAAVSTTTKESTTIFHTSPIENQKHERTSDITQHAKNLDVRTSPIRATTTNSSLTSALLSVDGKLTRPFKVFPRDPLVIAANFAATDVLLDNPRVERYTEYRKRVLEQIRSVNGGEQITSNPKMRRLNSCKNVNVSEGFISSNNNSAEETSDCDSAEGRHTNNDYDADKLGSQNADFDANNQIKDSAYYERRRKNNAAAKRSRDRRRIKEDELAIRAVFLERQNIELLCQIDALKQQLAAVSAQVRV